MDRIGRTRNRYLARTSGCATPYLLKTTFLVSLSTTIPSLLETYPSA